MSSLLVINFSFWSSFGVTFISNFKWAYFKEAQNFHYNHEYGGKFLRETKDLVFVNYTGYSLDEIEKDCWLRLVNGAIKSRDPFHTPCVATVKNGEVSMRTVVLRKALPLSRELRFHTDTRSNKWKELEINDAIGVLLYDSASRIQLRIKGKAVLHFNDDITSEAWQKTILSSRRCYLTQASPSSFSPIPTSGLTEEIEQENFTLEESEAGLQYFGIVSIHVESIDWLWLNHAGHRRAFFDYVHDTKHWMIP